MEKQPDFTLGQLQIINLDLIRQEAGELWPELRAKVFDVSEHFISRRLDSTDTLVRCEEGFLVVFAPENARQAERRTKRISDDLNSFYLGDEFFRRLKVRSSAITVNAASLAQFLSQQGADPSTPDPARDKTAKRANEAGYEELPIPAFEAAWDARQETVVASFCRPKRRFAGEIIFGHHGIHTDDVKRLVEIDLTIASAAAEQIKAAWSDGFRAGFSFTPHYRTVDAPASRQKYLEILNSIPDPVRRRLSLTVSDIPAGAPAVRLIEMFRTARETGMKLMAELQTLETDLRNFADCDVRIFVIPSAPGEGPISRAERDRYTLFVERAKTRRTLVAVTGVTCPLRLRDHIKLGAVFATGPIIAPMAASPIAPTTLPLAALTAPDRRSRQS